MEQAPESGRCNRMWTLAVVTAVTLVALLPPWRKEREILDGRRITRRTFCADCRSDLCAGDWHECEDAGDDLDIVEDL